MVDNFMHVLELIKEKPTNNLLKKSHSHKPHLYKTLLHDNLPNQLKLHIKQHKYSLVPNLPTPNYTKLPSISIYHHNITKQTNHPYYFLYLFHPQPQPIYLSFNQASSNI
ncbi:MrcB family domain-containing protein, partial [Staphylococcus epidermidis]|uniref:MrcB family domain-containing protein n=1 Tax=Staphylococcus epidermidis TaxID=1282 RepID=UPI00119FA3A9